MGERFVRGKGGQAICYEALHRVGGGLKYVFLVLQNYEMVHLRFFEFSTVF